MNPTLLLAPLLALSAGAGNEIVLVLDNSGSMIAMQMNGKNLPGNDPERAAVLGSLIVEGLARGSQDRVTIIAFGDKAGDPPRVVTSPDDLRFLPYVGGTFFKTPLEEARRRLEASALDKKLFIFFTDGLPEDLQDPAEGPAALGLAQNPTWDTLVIGLYGSDDAKQQGQLFLKPLARNPEDLVFVRKPQEVVAAFMKGYARALGSRPETGTLSPGSDKSVQVGKYVVEVLAAVASSQPGKPFQASLKGPNGEVPVQASGDNACQPGIRFQNAPGVCVPPYRHYQVFRAQNDPEKPSSWTLSLPSGSGDVDFGLVLRYDLVASLAVPGPVRVGDKIPVEASLMFRGKVFDDEAFFAADGFQASMTIDGRPVALSHAGKGRFVGDWTPERPTLDTPALAQVTFRNAWMEKTARQQVAVEGFLDLTLVPNPRELDLGTWQGERKETKRCQTLDLAGSTNADRVPITCAVLGELAEGALTCAAVPGSEANLPNGKKGQPLKYEVCATARPCCGEMKPSGLAVKLAGQHPHYAAGAVSVPVRLGVEATGFLRCWWLWIAIGLGALFLVFLIVGFVKPHDFDAAATVYVAGSELGLKRASGLVLRELPGGKKGFYRNARVCLNAAGDFVRSPGQSVLAVEAGPAGTNKIRRAAGLERKVQRTGKWEPVPPAELEQGYMPNTVYRLGNLHVKFA